MEIRRLLQWTMVIMGISIILGYGIFAFKGIVWGPRVILNTSLNGSATTSPLVVVSGRSIRITRLFLNGATTTLDLAGNFSESLLLSRGYNIMTLEGFDKYGRGTKEIIEMTLRNEIATSTATSTINNL